MKRKLKVKSLKFKVTNQEGFVLVVSLLLLLVVTVIGFLALSTSTTEVMIAGNKRLMEMNFSGAESGLEISDPTIRSIVYNQYVTSNYAGIVQPPGSDSWDLPTELRIGPPFNSNDSCKNNPDLLLANFGGNMNVTVDIDRMFTGPCEGSAIEFASGYEGIGMGVSGGICAYYRVNSMSRDTANLGAENVVGGVYRYVSY
ncbi:MAG: PilX N-terminal domain-containing pilus assembly protein [Nitrospirota bacterium]